MVYFKQKPYDLFLVTAVLIFIASFFVSNQTLDIQTFDIYFVIAMSHVCWATILLLLILWALNFFARKFLFSPILTWAHIAITLFSLILILFLSRNNYYSIPGILRRYFPDSSWVEVAWYALPTKEKIVISLFCLGLLIFFINIFIGLINWSRGNTRTPNSGI